MSKEQSEETRREYLIHEVECVCQNTKYLGLAHAAPATTFEIFQLVNMTDGTLIKSIYECDYCGRLWRVNEFNDYELVAGNANKAVYTKPELIKKLPDDLVKLLQDERVSTSKYAWSLWVLENLKFDETIALSNKENKNNINERTVKLLRIEGIGEYSIKNIKSNMGVVSIKR